MKMKICLLTLILLLINDILVVGLIITIVYKPHSLELNIGNDT